MKNKKLSFIKIPHSKDCWAKGGQHEWSGILAPKPFYHGNFSGNENTTRGNYHIWYNIICNNPKCNGVKAVHSSVLINA